MTNKEKAQLAYNQLIDFKNKVHKYPHSAIHFYTPEEATKKIAKPWEKEEPVSMPEFTIELDPVADRIFKKMEEGRLDFITAYEYGKGVNMNYKQLKAQNKKLKEQNKKLTELLETADEVINLSTKALEDMRACKEAYRNKAITLQKEKEHLTIAVKVLKQV